MLAAILLVRLSSEFELSVAMRKSLVPAVISLAFAGCASDAQLLQQHEAELSRRDTARTDARADIQSVEAVVAEADLEKCRNILRNRWHIFGGSYRVDAPLRPDPKFTCATKRPQGWFDTEKPVRAAFVTRVTYIRPSGDESFRKLAYCIFEIKAGKVVSVAGEIGAPKRHIRDTCHSI
jgi:hypothetical protein